MNIGEEVIQVLDYLADKMGIAIDWTGENVMPYINDIFIRFIKWEKATSVAWIVIFSMLIVASIISIIFIFKTYKGYICDDEFKVAALGILFCLILVGLLIIGFQTFDIIECNTLPEKVLYEYISRAINK